MKYAFKTVCLVISQPRLNHVSEHVISVEDLLAFGEQVRAAAAVCSEPDAPLNPSEKACRWCRAKARCPALAEEVSTSTGLALDADFDDLDDGAIAVPTEVDTLAQKMQAIPLIESWCKAVRAEVERNLLAGTPVPGYKLVQGRRGARRWANPAEAEETLKSLRLKLDEMYSLSLISPSEAEKRTQPWFDAQGFQHPPAIGPRQWKKVAPLITQSDGSLSVAPASDKRPAVEVQISTDEFENLDDTSVDDLL